MNEIMNNKEEEKIDIYFIAKKAKVSAATVSRVFNNEDIVTEKTKNKVLEICRQYNYKPSNAASSMRTKRTHYIGFVIPDMENPFYFEMLEGADDFAASKNYSLVLCNSGNDYQKELRFFEQVILRNVDGVIISGSTYRRQFNFFIKEIIKKNIPCVLADRLVRGLNTSSVITNNFKGGMLAADYLLKQGHKKIGIIGSKLTIMNLRNRYSGFKNVLTKHGLKEEFFIEFPIGPKYFREDFVKHRNLLISKKATAVFCISDVFAIDLIEYLKTEGISVPKDLSVIGFDNISLTKLVEPQLTTIAQEIRKIGVLSAEILINNIESKKEKMIVKKVLEPKLIIRNSVRSLLD